jgi:hypothetical protein
LSKKFRNGQYRQNEIENARKAQSRAAYFFNPPLVFLDKKNSRAQQKGFE